MNIDLISKRINDLQALHALLNNTKLEAEKVPNKQVSEQLNIESGVVEILETAMTGVKNEIDALRNQLPGHNH